MENGAASNLNSDLRTNMALPQQQETRTVEGTIIELTFPSTLPKDCLCLLCKQLIDNPCHLTCCAARYCDSCAQRMITTSYPCVKCSSKQYRKEVDDKDEAVKQDVQMLQVCCPMKINGCLWEGKVKNIEQHLCWGEYDASNTHNCRYLEVPCPRKCGKGVPRRDMKEHLQLECEIRHLKCEHCEYKGMAGEVLSEHREKCATQPVECPNGCKMPGIKRNRLSYHMEGECPLRLIPCDYQHIGCEERFQFKDRLTHNERNVQEHFYLMTEKMLYLSGENEQLTSLCLSVQHTCNKLQDKYDSLASLIVDTQEQSNSDSQNTYLVIKRNTLKRSPRTPVKPVKPPSLPQRTLSMMKSASLDSPDLEESKVPPLPPKGTSSVSSVVSVFTSDEIDFLKSPPLPPKGIRRASFPALSSMKKPAPPLPPKSQSTSTPAFTREKIQKKVPMLPPKRNSSVPNETQVYINIAEKKTPPPPPNRKDSLSVTTLPRKKEIKHQRKHSAQALAPIKDSPSHSRTEEYYNFTPSSSNHTLAPPSRAWLLNKSLPNLLIEEEKSEESEGTLERGDAYKPRRSWSSSSDGSSSFKGCSNPCYSQFRSNFSRYEVHTDTDRCLSSKDDSSPDTISSPTSDKESSFFGRGYQNIALKSVTMPVERTINITSRRPQPTPRKWASVDGVNEGEENKLHDNNSASTEMMNNNVANMYRKKSENDPLDKEGTEQSNVIDSRITNMVAINPMYPIQSELSTKLKQLHSHS